MKHITTLVLILIFLLSPLLFKLNTNAAEFSEAYLRLDRLKANSALSGEVCAKSSSEGAGTEAKVSLLFPSDFSLNTTASNWTTNTSNLPAGATAWPGIGSTTTSITGRAVTFASSDLTNGSALYCFNFTAASSTTGSAETKTGTITTLNSSNGIIDLTDYGFTIVSNDQITVTAKVGASANDVTASIIQLTEDRSDDNFPQGIEIEYEITYGSAVSSASNIILEAPWSLGTIEGNSTATVEVVGYVSGSATNAYNSTPPVIDSINRKITWEIDNFPGNTLNQTVRYKLRTIGNYTGPNRVEFINSARVLFEESSSVTDSIKTYYKYEQPSSGTGSNPNSTGIPSASIKQLFRVLK